MNKVTARWIVRCLTTSVCLTLLSCAPPVRDPSPPAMPSASEVVATIAPTVTPAPSVLPPSPTPEREAIAAGNLFELTSLYQFGQLNNTVRAVVFDPAGRYLAAITGGNSQGSDHRIHVWSTETGEKVGQSEEFGVDGWDLVINPRGDRLAVGLQNGVVAIYTFPELSLLQSFSHAGAVNALAYSPDGMYVAAGVAETDGGMVYLWNVDQGVLVRRNWAHPYSVPSLDFSPNGQYLASGAVDRSVKIWQVSNGQLIRTLPQDGQGTSIRFSPGGEWLASAMCAKSTTGFRCVEGQVWLWAVNDWTLDRKLTGPVDWVEGVAFSPDGQLVIGGGRDNGIYIWDRSGGSLLRSISAHQGSVQSVTASADGRLLASGATDESVILWGIKP